MVKQKQLNTFYKYRFKEDSRYWNDEGPEDTSINPGRSYANSGRAMKPYERVGIV